MSNSPRRSPDAGSSRPTTAITLVLRRAARFDRSQVSVAAGLIAATPLIAVFGISIAAGDPVAAATMGAGAMLVGIAWRVAGGRPPLMLMSTDALLMALSTFLGSVTGSLPWLHLLVIAVWALAAGLLVAIGRRGAVVGTQAVIGIVVFGRFTQPPVGALEIAGLVLAGGLSMVLFVAVVRWPSPLRLQRRTVAYACRALSQLVSAPSSDSTIPAAERLDEARAALSVPALFGDPAVLSLRSLADEGGRLRIELRAIHVLLEQGHDLAPEADDQGDHDEGDHDQGDPMALARTSSVLELGAGALKTIGAAVDGNRKAVAELPELSRRVVELEEQISGTGSGRTGAGSTGSSGAGSSSGAAGSSGAGSDVSGTDVERRLSRRLVALCGQLRAMLRLAEATGTGRGLRQRRPRAITGVLGEGLRYDFEEIRANATISSPAGRHAVRLAVVVVLAELLAEHVPLQRSYWIVVAAATVLRPDYASTFTRGAERMIGTCAGVALAGLIIVGLHPSLGVAVPIVGALGWLAYSVFPASFAVGFAFITTLVVFLLDAVSPDTLAIAGDRLIDTVVGGALGLIAYALWPTWSRTPARQAFALLVGAQRLYLAAVIAALTTGTPADRAEVSRLARRARRAYAAAQETVALSLDEPATRRIDVEQSQGMLAALRRLVSVIHLLRVEVQEERSRRPMPALGELAGDIDTSLLAIAAALPKTPDAGAFFGVAAELPDLRETYTRLARSAQLEPADELRLRELDELVDVVNSLAALTSSPPGW